MVNVNVEKTAQRKQNVNVKLVNVEKTAQRAREADTRACESKTGAPDGTTGVCKTVHGDKWSHCA
jgi:hypothetical protein